jgi:hypothetical protein
LRHVLGSSRPAGHVNAGEFHPGVDAVALQLQAPDVDRIPFERLDPIRELAQDALGLVFARTHESAEHAWSCDGECPFVIKPGAKRGREGNGIH